MSSCKSDQSITKCKCPTCGDIYTVKEFYTGRGLMRRYCWQCKDLVGMDIDYDMIYSDSGKRLTGRTPSILTQNKDNDTMTASF